MTAARELPGVLCQCGEAAARTVGSVAYCQPCADDLLDGIRERLRARDVLQGWGQAVAATCDGVELLPGEALLRCVSCGAGWVGRHGDPCGWCEHSLVLLQRDQSERLLRPELPEHGDRRRPGALKGWAGRLNRGAEAGLVTAAQARRAWRREVGCSGLTESESTRTSVEHLAATGDDDESTGAGANGREGIVYHAGGPDPCENTDRTLTTTPRRSRRDR